MSKGKANTTMASDILAHPIEGFKPSKTTKPSSTLSAAHTQNNGPITTTDGDSSHPVTTGGPQSKDQAKVESSMPGISHARFPRISRPVELLRTSYDVVVIGSGYGGGVAASRMARGRQSVCLLERGKEKWPGEYPTELDDAMKEFHVSGDFTPGQTKGKRVEGGDVTGLYHLVVGEGQNAFVGNGLGGTSLLNANVFLEADSQVLKMGIWPEELKGEDIWNKCTLSLFSYGVFCPKLRHFTPRSLVGLVMLSLLARYLSCMKFL
jgi:hypothetical protein